MPSRLSTIYVPPPLAVEGLAVSSAEVDYFKANGFLFKRGLLNKAQIDSAMDKVWEAILECAVEDGDKTSVERDDPTSWRSPVWKSIGKADKSGYYEERQRNAVHGRTVKMHDIGNEFYLLDLVPHNPKVRDVAQHLLAEDLKRVERTRGVYAFFPGDAISSVRRRELIRGEALGPHTDRVCQQLNLCAYLDDVPPRSGGFTVFPGSHAIMYKAHQFDANWSPNENFRTLMQEVVDTITPVEFVGQKGDVVFWHGRTVHTAGIHVGDSIRWAVFADFTQNRPFLTPNQHREVGQYEWFKDTKLFIDDDRVNEDMWRNWRLTASTS